MRWLAALTLVLSCTTAHANMLVKMSLDEMVHQSDLVVIGVATAHGDKVANISVETALKGRNPMEFELLTDIGIAEGDPNCCVNGQRYLMFLRKTKDGYFMSVDGHFGVVWINQPGSSLRIKK
jgi:hypothetical protein